ncbi:MAG: type VI secretion system membrane subunit TssM [Burkholderiales bacterium]|nr:type VI secretion system membrane subunit TssM [Burkholderiales bacterium]
MSRIRDFLLDARTLTVLGFAALAAFLFVGASTLQLAMIWVGVALGLCLLAWLIVWGVKRWRARRAAGQFEAVIEQQADAAVKGAAADRRAEIEALRTRMQEAIKTIKTSKLGETSGSAALYELPWYMVIGNPAAGKSSAIVKSGLRFPFADNTGSIIQGIGGTRHCDWFFTTEGILLDTAGRYSVEEEDREEWRGFLGLLKKHRPKAPVNGIVIAASLAELGNNRPEFAIELAKQLRQRVQEITEQLEIFPPVYVVFTKADLIAGFAEFFMDRDRDERDRVWGATLPYDAAGGDAVAQFDRHFDELYEGLKESSVVSLSMRRGEAVPPGVLTFPLEFATLKPALRTFITTLFEDNPYQFRPVFRGFYFTSAVQEGVSTNRSSERVAHRFGLAEPSEPASAAVYSQTGFFLNHLFSRVIFADKNLVRQYTSRAKTRLRYATFFGSVALLGLLLAGWTWSTLGNRQLVANVQADFDKVVRLQQGRPELASRLEALEILQDRLQQLQRWRDDRPLALSLGLYQGDALEAKVRTEYFAGLREVMLQPAARSIEAYLREVNAHAGELKPQGSEIRTAAATPADAAGVMPAALSPAAAGSAGAASLPALPQAMAAGATAQAGGPSAGAPATPYVAASATNVTDAYNALKTYLMLADRQRLEAGHLSDQLTRFWREWLEANRGSMPREEMIRRAEAILSFAVTQLAQPDFPQVESNLAVLDQTRENLRRVVRGMPARERVYAEIKARAATRFAPVTVANIVGDDKTLVAGSHAISGAFTRRAWQEYVQGAIKDAAYKDLQADDWVLKTSLRDDLTLEGSPEQVQKTLTQMYKTEYVAEWQKFMQGVSVAEFASFDDAVQRMNRLGDPAASPIGKLMQTLYDETSWDNPSLVNAQLAKAQQGFFAWIKQTLMRGTPSQANVNINVTGDGKGIPMGPIGREFEALGRLMINRDNAPTLMRSYLEMLSKVRTRYNQIKTQGDAGPAAHKLMQQTLEGNGSELADALRLVDEQMLVGMSDRARATLRPLLVRPLMQAWAVTIAPAEAEINRVWTAQVLEPFQRTLADKYPFNAGAKIEAAPAEIAAVFGSDGAIARFTDKTLGPLVVRRGDVLTARTWADRGVRLSPAFTAGFPAWVAPVGGAAAAGGAAASEQPQTVFQILPLPAPGLTEYSVEIDGQLLRFRNTQAAWTNFTWPSSAGQPGVRIRGVTFDGRSVDFFIEPGRFGLEKMIGAAQRRKVDATTHELRWSADGLSVAVQLRIISQAGSADAGASGAAGSPGGGNGLRGTSLPTLVVGGPDAAAPGPGAVSDATSAADDAAAHGAAHGAAQGAAHGAAHHAAHTAASAAARRERHAEAV